MRRRLDSLKLAAFNCVYLRLNSLLVSSAAIGFHRVDVLLALATLALVAAPAPLKDRRFRRGR